MSNMLSEVRLLAVPLESDYKHTLYFDSVSDQTSYFSTKYLDNPVRATECSYQRKDKIIRFPACIDDIFKFNYVMYRNNAHSQKWYYAFIKRMEYKNDEMTEITIETDVMQTWLKDYTIMPSFIEREHVDNDEIGKHTIPEQLETGEYMCNKHTKADYTKAYNMIIVVGITETPDGEKVTGDLYDNIYSGIEYRTFNNNREGVQALNAFLAQYPKEGMAEAVVCMFLAPESLTYVREGNTIANSNTVTARYINRGEESTVNKNIDISDNTFFGQRPTNAKLMCYPYRYILASNNNGASAVYKYELFYERQGTDDIQISPSFKIEGCLTPGGSVRLIPTDYNGIERNDAESIPLGKYPILNWNSDMYTNWLTQNAVNIPLSIGTAVVTTGLAIAGAAFAPVTGGASAVATIGAIGAGVSGATSIASTVGEIYQHSLQPPQAEGNINSGDVVTASGDNDFHFYDMCIKPEYMKVIDDYFTMFGYKVNRLGNPLKNHRESFWYTKTIDVNIDGKLPQDDLQRIKQCYNNGITFWKNHQYIGNYIVPNGIVN